MADHRAHGRITRAAADQDGGTGGVLAKPQLAERSLDAKQRFFRAARKELLRELPARDASNMELEQFRIVGRVCDREAAAPIVRQHDVEILARDVAELLARRQA